MKKIIAFVSLVLTLYCTPVFAQYVSPAAFGFNLYDITNDEWPRMAAQTIRMWDLQCGGDYTNWQQIETAKGVYDWSHMDCAVSTIHSHGANIIYTFGHPPGWSNNNGGEFVQPTNIQDFYDFVTAIVTRYKGQIGAYEIWNEPNNQNMWTAAQIAVVAQQEYLIIKTIDPTIQILAPSESTAQAQLLYFQAAQALGSNCFCDIVNAHVYNNLYSSGFPNSGAPEILWNEMSMYVNSWADGGVGALPEYYDEGALFNNEGISGSDNIGLDSWTAKWLIFQISFGAQYVANYGWDNPYTCNTDCGMFYLAGSLYLLAGNSPGPVVKSNWLTEQGIVYRNTQGVLSGSTTTLKVNRISAANQIQNASASGCTPGVIGGSGAAPTNWIITAPDSANGITTTVVSCSMVDGLAGLTIRVAGTKTTVGSGQVTIILGDSTHIPVSLGQWWCTGAYVKMVAGTQANSGGGIQTNYTNSGGSFIADFLDPTPVIYNQPATAQLNQYCAPITNGSAVYIKSNYVLTYHQNSPVDETIFFSPFDDTGTIWDTEFTEANGHLGLMAWDEDGGPTDWTMPGGYPYCRGLLGQPVPTRSGHVTLGQVPIICESAPYKAMAL